MWVNALNPLASAKQRVLFNCLSHTVLNNSSSRCLLVVFQCRYLVPDRSLAPSSSFTLNTLLPCSCSSPPMVGTTQRCMEAVSRWGWTYWGGVILFLTTAAADVPWWWSYVDIRSRCREASEVYYRFCVIYLCVITLCIRSGLMR